MLTNIKKYTMKQILVPTDFSPESINACKVAASIAKKNKSEVTLLHLFDAPNQTVDQFSSGGTSTGAQAIQYMKGVTKKFNDLMDEPFFKGITIYEAVRSNKAYQGIIDESVKIKADLIVMGSQGVSGLEEMLVGSNTEKVVRHSKVPVLAVKQNVDEEFNVENIVFASDFGKESKATYPSVIEYAKIFNAKLHLLFINTASGFKPTNAIKESMQTFIDGNDYKNQTVNIYSDKTIEEGILHFSAEINADIIAINTHKRSGLMQLFSSNLGEDLVNHALRPVLTFKI